MKRTLGLGRVRVRKWAALLAAGFCGYLTLATSKVMPVTCPPEDPTPLERTFTRDEQFRSWQVTAVSAALFTRWEIQVTPAVSLTYLPPKGVEVTVVEDVGTDSVDPPVDGTDTSASNTSDSPPLPADYVLVGEGTLTVVCGNNHSLCEHVQFDVALEESNEPMFSLEAFAFRSHCASHGGITDLRLEPRTP